MQKPFRRISTFALALCAACGVAVASEHAGVGVTADEALAKLVEGNKHYVSGGMTAQGMCTAERRAELAKGQKPYAIILSCSDSRVPPEIVFDKAAGELFVVRVAGNVADPVVLGSIEYAAEHIGSPLVVVLGHERCGAVTSTIEALKARKKAEGNLGALVASVTPSAKKALAAGKGKGDAEVVESAVMLNTKSVKESLTKRSKVLAELVKEGKLKIVAARYDLDDGTVTVEN
jgi:carbonic anhydrase